MNQPVHTNHNNGTRYKYRRKEVMLSTGGNKLVDVNKSNKDSIPYVMKFERENASRKDFVPPGMEKSLVFSKPTDNQARSVEQRELNLVDKVFRQSVMNEHSLDSTEAAVDEFVAMSKDETPLEEMPIDEDSTKNFDSNSEENVRQSRPNTDVAKLRSSNNDNGSLFSQVDDKKPVTDAQSIISKRKEILKHSTSAKRHVKNVVRNRTETKSSIQANENDKNKALILTKRISKIEQIKAKGETPSFIFEKKKQPQESLKKSFSNENRQQKENEENLLKVIKLEERTSYGRSLKSKSSFPDFSKDNVILDYAKLYRGKNDIIADFSKGADKARLLVYNTMKTKAKTVDKRDHIQHVTHFLKSVNYTEENAEKRMIGKYKRSTLRRRSLVNI